MEKTDMQPRITPKQAIDTLRLIDSQIARHIPPASYDMSLEAFKYYKKLYQLHRGLEELISGHQEQELTGPTVMIEPLPLSAGIPSGGHAKETPTDTCWVLVDPDGRRHRTGDLQAWARENYALLGFQDPEDWRRICKGMRDVARFTVLGRPGPKTFRGWTVEQRPREKLSNTARTWTLVSPTGEAVQVYNLQHWIRENPSLFRAKDEKRIKYICNKFQNIAHSMRTGSNRHKSYKGWTVRL